jgi:hypothetical protein
MPRAAAATPALKFMVIPVDRELPVTIADMNVDVDHQSQVEKHHIRGVSNLLLLGELNDDFIFIKYNGGGSQLKLKVNQRATILLKHFRPMYPADCVGPVLVCGEGLPGEIGLSQTSIVNLQCIF